MFLFLNVQTFSEWIQNKSLKSWDVWMECEVHTLYPLAQFNMKNI